MKKTLYFCLETLIKFAFMAGAVFLFFYFPYYIMTGEFTGTVWLDLISMQLSMLVGCFFVIILNEVRKDCGRGVGIFFSIDKYKEH